MEFKDLQTGLVVNHDFVSFFTLLCDRNLCQNCQVNKIMKGKAWGGGCVDWVKSHMVEADTLAGYEYLGDTDERCCPSCANLGRYNEVRVNCKPDGNGGWTIWKPKKVNQSTDTSTDKLQYINSVYGRDEVFFQAAEESVELAQACDDLRRASMKLSKAVLKLRRAEHGTTPVSLTEATRAVLEECADVTVCIRALEAMGVFSGEELDSVMQEKLERWESRALEYEKRSGGNDSCC